MLSVTSLMEVEFYLQPDLQSREVNYKIYQLGKTPVNNDNRNVLGTPSTTSEEDGTNSRYQHFSSFQLNNGYRAHSLLIELVQTSMQFIIHRLDIILSADSGMKTINSRDDDDALTKYWNSLRQRSTVIRMSEDSNDSNAIIGSDKEKDDRRSQSWRSDMLIRSNHGRESTHKQQRIIKFNSQSKCLHVRGRDPLLMQKIGEFSQKVRFILLFLILKIIKKKFQVAQMLLHYPNVIKKLKAKHTDMQESVPVLQSSQAMSFCVSHYADNFESSTMTMMMTMRSDSMMQSPNIKSSKKISPTK